MCVWLFGGFGFVLGFFGGGLGEGWGGGGLCFVLYMQAFLLSACAEIFPGSSHSSDLNIGTPLATLPGAWRCRVSAGTGWPGVSKLTGRDGKFDLQLLSQCGSTSNFLSRSVPEIHLHVAGTLSNQQTSSSRRSWKWFQDQCIYLCLPSNLIDHIK